MHKAACIGDAIVAVISNEDIQTKKIRLNQTSGTFWTDGVTTKSDYLYILTSFSIGKKTDAQEKL